MTKAQLPKYDATLPWAELWSRALTRDQARTVRHTVAVTDPFTTGERAGLENCCSLLMDDHFLVAERGKTIAVWRTNPPETIRDAI